jgi:hypothetical protein
MGCLLLSTLLFVLLVAGAAVVAWLDRSGGTPSP